MKRKIFRKYERVFIVILQSTGKLVKHYLVDFRNVFKSDNLRIH